jgi:hypothetical protein
LGIYYIKRGDRAMKLVYFAIIEEYNNGLFCTRFPDFEELNCFDKKGIRIGVRLGKEDESMDRAYNSVKEKLIEMKREGKDFPVPSDENKFNKIKPKGSRLKPEEFVFD